MRYCRVLCKTSKPGASKIPKIKLPSHQKENARKEYGLLLGIICPANQGGPKDTAEGYGEGCVKMKTETNNNTDSFPELMTEEELAHYLRLPEISKAGNHHNTIENLKRMHGLPCIHLCKKPIYPLVAVQRWIGEKLEKERK